MILYPPRSSHYGIVSKEAERLLWNGKHEKHLGHDTDENEELSAVLDEGEVGYLHSVCASCQDDVCGAHEVDWELPGPCTDKAWPTIEEDRRVWQKKFL